MNRSASRASYCGRVVTALVSFVCFFTGWREASQALMAGLSGGWAVSVVVCALSTVWAGFKEKWGLEYD